MNVSREQALSMLKWNKGSWNFYRQSHHEHLDMRSAELQHQDLRKANLNGLDLCEANLAHANLTGVKANFHLRKANLEAANLTHAHLAHVNLSEANLGDVNFTGANLSHANLERVKHWQDIAHIRGANIFGVQNAPAGFHAWALANGAVEMANEAEWMAFKQIQNRRPARLPAKLTLMSSAV